MRPRLIAVDDAGAGSEDAGRPPASMRPRLIAVDDAAGHEGRPARAPRFNEATADRRG